MKAKRRNFTPEQKVAILRLHLLEHKPVSEICEDYDLAVNQFYRWQREFFENGAAAFQTSHRSRKTSREAKDKKIAALEEKLAKKNEVLSEVMEEHVQLKKELGEL